MILVYRECHILRNCYQLDGDASKQASSKHGHFKQGSIYVNREYICIGSIAVVSYIIFGCPLVLMIVDGLCVWILISLSFLSRFMPSSTRILHCEKAKNRMDLKRNLLRNLPLRYVHCNAITIMTIIVYTDSLLSL